MRPCSSLLPIWFCLVLSPLAVRAGEVDYNRDIRPILSEHCYKCHGPDEAERKSGLRLDLRDAALAAAESGEKAIVPGKPDDSELLRRILAEDAGERMPPEAANKPLSAAQKQLLKDWIEQGAEYQTLWSFVPPERSAVPAVKQADWPRNPIDHFILARLEAEGLPPAPEADKATLIRRLTLDLTGLPPTPAEVEAFLKDASPEAYEHVVDRLLASPHYGERMAQDWLDAARYADTHGYHIDSGRDMWRWREWVIESFNRNQPFDQFTVEQLAGDLLPEPSVAQLVASGFNRNHMINFEGGAIPLEYHTAYIVDRVNTTATVWLGLTVGCAQCHDHKFDPLTQKEFYQFFAFFHNVPENGLDGSKGNAMPYIKAPTSAQQARLNQLAEELRNAEAELLAENPEIDAAQTKWEKTALTRAEVAWKPLDPKSQESRGGATLTRQDDLSILATGTNPAKETYIITAPAGLKTVTGLQLEVLTHESLTAQGPGRSVNGNIVMTDLQVAIGDKKLALKTATADFSQETFPAQNVIDTNPASGWAIHPEVGKPHMLVVDFAEPLTEAEATTFKVTLDFQSQFAGHHPGRFRLSVTDARDPHKAAPLAAPLVEALRLPADKRTAAQQTELRTYFRQNVSEALQPVRDRLAQLQTERTRLDTLIPTTMVMQEMAQPRETFLLVRGQYDKKGEAVAANVPVSLPPLADEAPRNRLGLARWLVDPAHPLTSRVAVNRFWQMYFGTGLVKTSEDFGSQGELPSHPELLDWLATEFMQPQLDSTHPNGWDVKALQRLIVTSATYRQASHVSPEMAERDPENRLLARGPRFRLSAEGIRDQALAVSGLLVPKIGGKSVSPYQPAGLWEELMSRADGKNWTAQVYEQGHGEDLYRRTMYTFWKRTCPPPTLATFDAPDRETCTVRRARTNTPLQALVLLNDPTYVEASRKLAERLLTAPDATEEQRITLAFQIVLARPPRAQEMAVVQNVLAGQRAKFQADEPAAIKLLSIGETPRNELLPPSELAAWTMISSMLLNLDEAVTKG